MSFSSSTPVLFRYQVMDQSAKVEALLLQGGVLTDKIRSHMREVSSLLGEEPLHEEQHDNNIFNSSTADKPRAELAAEPPSTPTKAVRGTTNEAEAVVLSAPATPNAPITSMVGERQRERERERDRQTDRQTYRQTDRQTEKEIVRLRERGRERQRQRQRQT